MYIYSKYQWLIRTMILLYASLHVAGDSVAIGRANLGWVPSFWSDAIILHVFFVLGPMLMEQCLPEICFPHGQFQYYKRLIQHKLSKP